MSKNEESIKSIKEILKISLQNFEKMILCKTDRLYL